METIDNLLKKNNIDATVCNYDELNMPTSGTGYIYPSKKDLKVIKFTDSFNRDGYQFQIEKVDPDGNVHDDVILIHCRYSDSNLLCFCGNNDIYNDCIIRDYNYEKFMARFELLSLGKEIPSWNFHEYYNMKNSGNDVSNLYFNEPSDSMFRLRR